METSCFSSLTACNRRQVKVPNYVVSFLKMPVAPPCSDLAPCEVCNCLKCPIYDTDLFTSSVSPSSLLLSSSSSLLLSSSSVLPSSSSLCSVSPLSSLSSNQSSSDLLLSSE